MAQKKYIDQNQSELYDNYDLEANEKTPQMLLDAEVIKEGNRTDVIFIDYPTISGIWSLEGRAGQTAAYEEMGKKAFVRGGRYRHPAKKWESAIIGMSPLDYIKACAELFSERGNVTVEDLIEERLENYDLDEVFGSLIGDIFYLVLDYTRNTQEGLHRAVWALQNEIDEVPVIVIT